uniref:Uncharacterized protein n=1 Tax=Rhizophora mucronata TaxID=61149 RepID=A0A2P2JL18_RHIMU
MLLEKFKVHGKFNNGVNEARIFVKLNCSFGKLYCFHGSERSYIVPHCWPWHKVYLRESLVLLTVLSKNKK